jgi:hypothetical protein
MPEIMRQRRTPASFKVYPFFGILCYGACNDLDRSNCETAAWCVKAFAFGCCGVVPWQSIGGDEAFDIGDKPGNGNALIVDGRKRFGVNAVASFRVHALRAGAQLSELLRLLKDKRQWGDEHIKALVGQVIPLNAEFRPAFADDAAAVRFQQLNSEQFVRLKEGLLKLLQE